MSRSKKKSNKKSKCKNTELLPTEDNQTDSNTRSKEIYVIKKSDQLGRYLTASRNVETGEMIIESEPPLVIGPVQQSELVCLGCYKKILDVQISRCSKCKWPICNKHCEGWHKKNGHTSEECDLLSRIPFDLNSCEHDSNIYNFIVPMRCLLLKKTHTEKWQTLHSMESHCEIRKTIESIWEFNEITVARKLHDIFDPAEIHRVCGVLEVNSFEVNVDEISLRALFPTAYLMSHDCVPNTMHTNDNDFNLKVRASVPIPKGERITISYAYTLQGTGKRRSHIRETKFFDCTCKRCSDPSELGSNMSTIICPNCGRSSVTCSFPLESHSSWTCRNKKCARNSVTHSYVDDLITRLEEELGTVPENSIEGYEIWLKSATKYLHANHYLIVGVKYTLSLLYGKITGFMIQDMNEDLLRRKINVCEDLLRIADIVEPGLSRLRGIILYELQAPIMMLLQKSGSASTSKKHFKQSLQRVISYLQQSSEILKFECPNTMEGKIRLAAEEALLATRQWKFEGNIVT